MRLGILVSNAAALGVIAFTGACSSDPTGPQPTRPSFSHEPGHNFAYCLTNVVTGAAVSRTTVYTCTTTLTSSPYSYHSTSLGHMAPITYTFSRPVQDLDILAEGTGSEGAHYECSDPDTRPTYVAYGPTGTVVDSGGFLPGLCPTDRQVSVDLYLVGQISKVVITAPLTVGAFGYSATYRMEFNEPCPPTGDPVLDDPEVSSTLNLEWSRSKGDNLERAGWIYQNDATGEYVVTVDNGIRRDRCGVDFSSPVAPPLAGHTPVRGWHTHIIIPGTAVGTNCLGFPPTELAGNGPSPDADVPWVQETGLGHIILDDDQAFTMLRDGSFLSHDWLGVCRVWF